MISFPNCKINLGLRVVRKRDDGYHNLETIFYPLPLRDAVEVIRDTEPELHNDPVTFTGSGLTIAGEPTDNLCVKAWHLLKKDFPQLSPVRMHLHKVIPMGAGLGGGSADGAFTLRILNDVFHLELDEERLIQYALQLGSDCPFFILNKPCLATGRGEKMEVIDLRLDDYDWLLVYPGIHIATAKAFSLLTPAMPETALNSIVEQPVDRWKDQLINDFEAPAFTLFPALKTIKEQLYDAGAVYASMTGSGSALYGLFPKRKIPVILPFPSSYSIFRLDSKP